MISKKTLIYLFILTMGFSTCVGAEYMGFFESIDNFAYDLSFRIRGQRKPPDNIIIAAIDEKSLGKMGRWPIDRKNYAKLLDSTGQAGAVGFDIIMAEPSDSDPLLREAINRHGSVILPAYIDSRKNVVFPTALFSRAKLGHVHIEPDIDGVARKVFHTLGIKNIVLPSFASVICETVTGRLPDEVMIRAKPPVIQQGEILQSSLMNINYYGLPGTFRHVSLADIIDGTYRGDFFRGKIVLVGLTAIGLGDGLLTPFSQQRDMMAGVEVQANILSNLLYHNYIRTVDNRIKWLFSFTISFIVMFLLLRVKLRGVKLLIWWMFGMFALTVSSIVLFAYFNQWMSPTLPGFSLTLTFVMAYIFMLKDIGQQLLEAKDSWEHTFDAIDDAIVILDRKCQIILINEAAQKIYGQEFLKDYCRKFFQGNGQTFNASRVTRATNQSLQEKTVTEEIFDSSLNKYLEIRSLPRFDKRDNFEGAVLVIRNISGKKIAEEEQRMMQSQLFQSQKMEAVGLLAGGIAHDFNNILSAMMGYVTLIQMKSKEGDPARQYSDQLIALTNRAATLVKNLMAFSRKQVLDIKPSSLNDIVGNIGKLLSRVIGEDIKLNIKVSDKDIVVNADAGQMEQALINLATNARDAMPEGGTLTISTEQFEMDDDFVKMHGYGKPGKYALLTVEDTGMGIDEETRENIFEPFFTTKAVGKGTGLGLAMVYGTIKQHDGYINVYSEAGKGTTFRIYLPAIDTEAVEAKSLDNIPRRGGTETILLVEDDASLRHATRSMLEEFGYKVIEAEDGNDAVNKFVEHKAEIKLVIMDVIMPRKSGKEAYQEMQKIRPDVKVIFTSGHTGDMLTNKKIAEEGLQFISKPVLPRELFERIREALD